MAIPMIDVALTAADCQNVGTAGATVSDITGGIVRTSPSTQSAHAYTPITLPSDFAMQVTVNIVNDAFGQRHAGLLLASSLNQMTGARLAWQLNATFRATYFRTQTDFAEMAAIYDAKLPPLGLNQPATLRVEATGGLLTVHIDDVKCLELEHRPAWWNHAAFFAYGNTVEFTNLKIGIPDTPPDTPIMGIDPVRIAHSAPVSAWNTRAMPGLVMALDAEGGPGYATWTVLEEGNPRKPLRRRVWLLRLRDGRKVAEGWSDAATGQITFRDLPLDAAQYVAIALDHTGNFEALAGGPMPANFGG